MDFYCVMMNGYALTDLMRNHLRRAAQQMIVRGKERVKIRHDAFTATVTTAGKYAVMGDFGGQVFTGMVESDLGLTKVDFIVSQKIVEAEIADDLEWDIHGFAPGGATIEDYVVSRPN